MPGRLFLTTPVADLARIAGVAAPDWAEPPRRNIAPGQEIVVLTDTGLMRMRWGLIPQGRKNARGRPVMETIVNARSETVFDKSAFDGVLRALVPLDGWYEWTGATRRKTAWSLQRADGAPLWVAAIYDVWQAPGGRSVPQVATVTCAPNADVEPIHHRMGAMVDPDQFGDWLTGDVARAQTCLRPMAEGLLRITEAKGVDWTGP